MAPVCRHLELSWRMLFWHLNKGENTQVLPTFLFPMILWHQLYYLKWKQNNCLKSTKKKKNKLTFQISGLHHA